MFLPGVYMKNQRPGEISPGILNNHIPVNIIFEKARNTFVTILAFLIIINISDVNHISVKINSVIT